MSGVPVEVRRLPDYEDVCELAAMRDALLERLAACLRRDRRIEGAWLSGSFGRGEVDAWSDLDLHVAVADEGLEAVLAERQRLYAAVGGPILVQQEMRSDSMDEAAFQLVWYASGVEVDCNVGPSSRASKPPAHRLLFERRPFQVRELPVLTSGGRRMAAGRQLAFFWAMAPIAIKYAARRDVGKTVEMVRRLTDSFIRLSRIAHGRAEVTAWDPSLTNVGLDDAVEQWIPRIGAHVDPAVACDLIERLCQQVVLLEPHLRASGASVDPRMPAETRRMLALCRHTLTAEPPPQRPYR